MEEGGVTGKTEEEGKIVRFQRERCHNCSDKVQNTIAMRFLYTQRQGISTLLRRHCELEQLKTHHQLLCHACAMTLQSLSFMLQGVHNLWFPKQIQINSRLCSIPRIICCMLD
jgi:hypothetical protein